jgi:hypothetical protein
VDLGSETDRLLTELVHHLTAHDSFRETYICE